MSFTAGTYNLALFAFIVVVRLARSSGFLLPVHAALAVIRDLPIVAAWTCGNGVDMQVEVGELDLN